MFLAKGCSIKANFRPLHKFESLRDTEAVPHRRFSAFSPVVYQWYNCWPCQSDVFQTLIRAQQVHVFRKLHWASVDSVLLERHGKKKNTADRIPRGETIEKLILSTFTESAHLLLMNIDCLNGSGNMKFYQTNAPRQKSVQIVEHDFYGYPPRPQSQEVVLGCLVLVSVQNQSVNLDNAGPNIVPQPNLNLKTMPNEVA